MKHTTRYRLAVKLQRRKKKKKQKKKEIKKRTVSTRFRNENNFHGIRFRALSEICLLRVRLKDSSFFSISLFDPLFLPRPAILSVHPTTCRLLHQRSYNFSQKASIIVIVRKFMVDGVVRGATTCESSQGEETERNVDDSLEKISVFFVPESSSQSAYR